MVNRFAQHVASIQWFNSARVFNLNMSLRYVCILRSIHTVGLLKWLHTRRPVYSDTISTSLGNTQPRSRTFTHIFTTVCCVTLSDTFETNLECRCQIGRLPKLQYMSFHTDRREQCISTSAQGCVFGPTLFGILLALLLKHDFCTTPEGTCLRIRSDGRLVNLAVSEPKQRYARFSSATCSL